MSERNFEPLIRPTGLTASPKSGWQLEGFHVPNFIQFYMIKFGNMVAVKRQQRIAGKKVFVLELNPDEKKVWQCMKSSCVSFTIAYAAISSLNSGLYLKYFPRFDLSSFVAANKAFTADTVVSVIS